MFEKLDEAQLLALVEGELDTQEAESLRQQLAGDPEALAVIERMIHFQFGCGAWCQSASSSSQQHYGRGTLSPAARRTGGDAVYAAAGPG